MFYQSDIRGNALTRERMLAYQKIFCEPTAAVITTMDALLEKLILPKALKEAVLSIKVGQELELDELRKKLSQNGYEYNYQAEQPGQFAVRGGILDVFPLTEEVPYRIEFWGDEVDSIRSFDAESQRSMENLEMIQIYPASELVAEPSILKAGAAKMQKDGEILWEKYRKEMKTEEAARLKEHTRMLVESVEEMGAVFEAETCLPYFYDETVSILEYMKEACLEGADPLVCLDEPGRCMDRGAALFQEFSASMEHRLEKGYVLPRQLDVLYDVKTVLGTCRRFMLAGFSTLEHRWKELPFAHTCSFRVNTVNSYNSSFSLLIKDLGRYQKQKYKVLVLCASRTRAKRMAEDLQNEQLHAFYSEDTDRILAPGEIMVQYGKLTRGFEYPDLKFVVLTETDIFGAEKRKKKRRH